MHSLIRSVTKCLAGLSVCSILSTLIYAQTGQGTIVGMVTDATSAVVAGVSVTARNPETGFTYTALTNEEGLYRILYVNPGIYEVVYEARGFRKVIRSGVLVRSTETARVDIALELGGVVESVEVKVWLPCSKRRPQRWATWQPAKPLISCRLPSKTRRRSCFICRG